MNTKQTTCVFIILTLFVSLFSHQPFFESKDLKPSNPWIIKNPQISTVIYAALDSSDDVDYYSFSLDKNEKLLFDMVIPFLKSSKQENFIPYIAIFSKNLPYENLTALPKKIQIPKNMGCIILIPSEKNEKFYEPFSNNFYWQRQKEYFISPKKDKYIIAVYDNKDSTGKYAFTVGDREEIGGDPLFIFKLNKYFK